MKRRIVNFILLFIICVGSLSCSPSDNLGSDVYTWGVYPSITNTYDLGNYVYRWRNAYFNNINVNNELTLGGVVYTSANISFGGNITGVTATLPLTSTGGAIPDIGINYDAGTLQVVAGSLGVIPGLYVTAEVDPIFSASPSFGITAANITTWSSLVSSQWVDDVSGINYDGSVGIHTNSSATGLLALYSSDGISNDPVLNVMDNSASAEAVGIRVSVQGAKTDYTDGIYVTNSATTATAGATKYGVRIKTTGNWLGVGSVNYGLYIEPPTGGTTNVAAFIDGLVDMSSNYISNLLDPVLAQDAATKNYIDTAITGNLTGYVPYIGATTNVTLGAFSLTSSNIFGNGTYLRVGDAITTQVALASNDDLMVTGKLEVYGLTYHTGIAYLGGTNVTTNPTAWGTQTVGIQIDATTSSAPVFDFKGTGDILHGMTSLCGTSTWGFLRMAIDNAGGIAIQGFTDDTGASGSQAVLFMGSVGQAPDTTKSTAARGVVEIQTWKKSGTSHTPTTGADNALTICAGSTAQYVFGANGNLWQSGGLTLGDVLNMNTHQINNVVDPTLAQDAATKNYIDTQYVPYVGATDNVNLGVYSIIPTRIKMTSATLLVTPEAGVMEYDGTGIYLTNYNHRRFISQAADSIIASVSVNNTAVETTVFTGTLNADELKAHRVYRLSYYGHMDTASAADTVTVRVKLNGTTLATLTSAPGITTGSPFHGNAVFTVRTTGAGGTVSAHVDIAIGSQSVHTNTPSLAVDTTAINSITISFQWSAAKVDNVMDLDQCFLEVLD